MKRNGEIQDMTIIEKGAAIPQDVSDVILMWNKSKGTWYYNCQLGKGSYCVHSVTRNSTKNIFIGKRYGCKQLGYWVDHTKDTDGEDILAVRICSFDIGGINDGETRNWKNEFDGYIIDKDGNAYSSYFYATGTDLNNMIDMFSEQCSLVPTDYHVRRSNYTNDVLKDFFGTIGFADGMSPVLFSSNYAIPSIVQYSIPKTPTKKQALVDELISKQLPPLLEDEETKNLIFSILQRMTSPIRSKDDTKQYTKQVIYHDSIYGGCNVSIIQKVEDGTAVMRIFAMLVDVNKLNLAELQGFSSFEEMKIYEFGRTYITDNEIISCRDVFGKWLYFKMGQKNYNYGAILIPWEDAAVEGTKMSYFKSIRDSAKEAIESDGTDDENGCYGYYLYHESREIGMKLHAILESPIFESLMNSGLENITELLMNRISSSTPNKLLEDVLGKFDKKQKSFLKAAAVPFYMLKEIDSRIALYNSDKLNSMYSYAWKISEALFYLKKWFESCPDYLSRMDKSSFDKLLDAYMVTNLNANTSEMIENIVYLYGPKNLDAKLLWIQSNLPELKSNTTTYTWWSNRAENLYMDYINMCKKMDYRNMPWKFKTYFDLKRAHEQMVEVFNLFKDEKMAKESRERFEKVKAKWDKLTYASDDFCVIAPEKTEDIANEGIELHHCVRSYIDAVLNGDTNILFVRKASEIDKPFYTLEIKGKRIRQCHGFGNCNTCEYPGLEDFLKKYCEDKKIQYSDGNGVLAVGR